MVELLYRDHRGGYSESMKTVKAIKSKQQLFDHVVSLGIDSGDIDDLLIEEYKWGSLCNIDKRNGWKTHIVTFKGVLVGWANNDFNIFN